MDRLETTNGMYLKDEDELQYKAYNHELVTEELRVRGVKNINIKFNKKYATQRKIEKIVFSDIILDYDSYSNNFELTNRINLEIEL